MYSRCVVKEGDEETSHCKSKEEIDEKMELINFVLMTNDVRFDSSKYGDESIVRESTLSWMRVSFDVSV